MDGSDTLNIVMEYLHDLPELSTRKMFGGLCIMSRGHMVAGVDQKDDLMVRVGKPNMAAALALSDVEPMQMGSRTMGGFVDVDPSNEESLAEALTLARAFVSALPAK